MSLHKIKCELGSTGEDPPCERCLRLGKNCVVSPPVRQKDRVAELEAKVEALTKLLMAQEIRTVSSPVDLTTELSREGTAIPQKSSSHETSKKRRLEVNPLANGKDTLNGIERPDLLANDNNLELDLVVPRDVQVQTLDKYRNEMEPIFALASLPAAGDYATLRRRHPLLLQVIIYVACPGMLSVDVQEDIAKVIVKLLSPDAVAGAQKSLQLVQAIQIATSWYRMPRHHVHLDLFQLIRLGAKIAEDIGIGGSNWFSSTGTSSSSEHMDGGDAWRAWIVCYLLSACGGACMRIDHPISWNSYHECSLFSLEYWTFGLSTDRLLCQIVRAERLCEQIASKARFNDFTSVLELTDPAIQLAMHDSRNLIKDWKARISPSLRCPILGVWEHAATLFLHECVLHTATNKQSFAAPYVAERLSVTDFPAPIVEPDHVVSIHALRDASHTLLDLFTSLDVPTIMALPALLFTARAAYAYWILIKLYVSVTAQGNTYGAFLDVQSLQLEEYLGKVQQLATKVQKVDSMCGPGRILKAAQRLREWIWAYDDSLVNQKTTLSVSSYSVETDVVSEDLLFGDSVIDWETLSLFNDSFEYRFEDLSGHRAEL